MIVAIAGLIQWNKSSVIIWLVFQNPVAYVTQFVKTRQNDTFLEIQIFASISSIYIPKALFCSNIDFNAVLQILFELQS